MDKIIIIILAITMLQAKIKKVDVFKEFISGVKESMQLVLSIFPTMMAFMFLLSLLLSCGILPIIQSICNNLSVSLQLPIEIFMVMVLRPFSSSGALALTTNIFNQYGIDSNISLLSSIIQTGSDTTFYVVALYFGSIGITKYRFALKLGLFLDFIACMFALICFYLFL